MAKVDLKNLNPKEKIDLTIKGYNDIANFWDQTRLVFWPELESLILNTIDETIKSNDGRNIKLLDIGCGNGRLLRIVKDKNITYSGFDPSEELIKIARKTWPSNTFNLGQLKENPSTTFTDAEFDLAISIAVIHHIPKELVRDWLLEIARIVKPDGSVILTSWDLSTSRYELDSNGDAVIDFMNYKDVRFQHNYTKQEIEDLINNSPLHLESYNEISRESGNTNLVFVLKKSN